MRDWLKWNSLQSLWAAIVYLRLDADLTLLIFFYGSQLFHDCCEQQLNEGGLFCLFTLQLVKGNILLSIFVE